MRHPLGMLVVACLALAGACDDPFVGTGAGGAGTGGAGGASTQSVTTTVAVGGAGGMASGGAGGGGGSGAAWPMVWPDSATRLCSDGDVDGLGGGSAVAEVCANAPPVQDSHVETLGTSFVTTGGETVETRTGFRFAETDIAGTNMPASAAKGLCEASTTGGHTDWRLPNVYEMSAVIDYGRDNRTEVSPNGYVHPLDLGNTRYWVDGGPVGRYVSGLNGSVGVEPNGIEGGARCIRGDAFVPSWTNEMGALYREDNTGLLVDLTALGPADWKSALSSCPSGFRLPSAKEGMLIAPAAELPDLATYWTNTAAQNELNQAFVVGSTADHIELAGIHTAHQVVCVSTEGDPP